MESSDFQSEALTSGTELSKAGLEVKQDKKHRPRLIVHDIPVELERARIAEAMIEQNLSVAGRDDLDVKYLYPAGQKKFRSCVIKAFSAIKEKIPGRGR